MILREKKKGELLIIGTFEALAQGTEKNYIAWHMFCLLIHKE